MHKTQRNSPEQPLVGKHFLLGIMIVISVLLHCVALIYIRMDKHNEQSDAVRLQVKLVNPSENQLAEVIPSPAKLQTPMAVTNGVVNKKKLPDSRRNDQSVYMQINGKTLLENAIEFARRQEAHDFEVNMKKKRIRELTTDNSLPHGPFPSITDSAGWTHIVLNDKCLVYREAELGEQFDEPVMMYTPCLNESKPRALLDDLFGDANLGGVVATD
jgi:hypothetical protein